MKSPMLAKEIERQEKVKTLSGLLTVCAWCKRLRNNRGRWRAAKAYFRMHSEAEFTHGICPECQEKHLSRRGALSARLLPISVTLI
jgi:hypothetical protein